MENILEFMLKNKELTGGLVVLIVGVFVRLYPKKKLFGIVGPIGFNIGLVITKFGNSRIGKSAMEKLEEGFFTTIIGVIAHFFNEILRGAKSDNDVKGGDNDNEERK